MWAQGKAAATTNEPGGDDVPEVFGYSEGGDKIENVADVRTMAAANGATVSIVRQGQRGLYLHADEMPAMSDDEIEARHLSPGLVYLQAMFDGAGHKTHFCPLAAQFTVSNLHTTFH